MDHSLQAVENNQPAKDFSEQNDPFTEGAQTQYLLFNQTGCSQWSQTLIKLPHSQNRKFIFSEHPYTSGFMPLGACQSTQSKLLQYQPHNSQTQPRESCFSQLSNL